MSWPYDTKVNYVLIVAEFFSIWYKNAMWKNANSKERDVILDSITEGVFTVDLDWNITSFNRAAEEITGISRQEAIGQQCRDILRADLCETDCALPNTIETAKPIINKFVHIIDFKVFPACRKYLEV